MNDKQLFEVEKTQLVCYKIRGDKGNFADFTLDFNGTKGRLSIASDFGSWSYYWGACGVHFKEFLMNLNMEYAADKFGEGRFFDLEKTVELLTERANAIEDEELRKKTLEEVRLLSHCNSKGEFIAKMWTTGAVLEMENYSPDIVESVSPSFKTFWDRLWKVFINVITREVNDPHTNDWA